VKCYFRVGFVLFASLVAVSQSDPNLAQCRSGAGQLVMVETNSDFSSLSKSMTTGDELVLSTRLARCLELYPTELTPVQFSKLDRMVYKLDADIIQRMFDFIERRHLTNAFNNEEEQRRVK
jgi:hypothetical protein